MKITLLTPVAHDGAQHDEGDTIDVKDEAQAKALIEAGAAEEAGKKSKAKAKAEADGGMAAGLDELEAAESNEAKG